MGRATRVEKIEVFSRREGAQTPRMADNRMGWVRTIDALASAASPPIDVLEVEFASEVSILGECTLANGALLMRPITFAPDDKGFFKYVLRQVLPQRVAPVPEGDDP